MRVSSAGLGAGCVCAPASPAAAGSCTSDALEKGMEAKAAEFVQKGAEIYSKA
jgi:hypothetical protein